MGEVKVETGSLTGKVSDIASDGASIKFDTGDVELSKTNIDPFVDFMQASALLETAMNNYASIVSQDTKAMQNVVDEIEKTDTDMANQIEQSTSAQNSGPN
ncbi:TIGR04197 family type VII secretion effector [Staphylococcus simulans]